MHGFADASSKAYAAAVYVRAKDKDGNIHVSLIAAKTRIAPLKQVSVPRLELCAALTLTRLIKLITEALPHKIVNINAWSDSTVVLSWLSVPPIQLKTFVGNRTAEIIETLPRNLWNHVVSKQNPADCASRGMSAEELLKFDLWWRGPVWLRDELQYQQIIKNNCTSQFLSFTEPEVAAEVKVNKISCVAQTDSPLSDLIERISTWKRLVNIMAYVQRFIHTIRFKTIKSAVLSFQEITTARSILIKLAQDDFDEERECLKLKKPVSHQSKLFKLHPYIDDHNILRVGGRISNSLLDEHTIHPII